MPERKGNLYANNDLHLQNNSQTKWDLFDSVAEDHIGMTTIENREKQ